VSMLLKTNVASIEGWLLPAVIFVSEIRM